MKTVRLLLGDQLNINHSWFQTVDEDVTYILMEIKPESEYVTHHIQKILGIFKAMRTFAHELTRAGHSVRYYEITDSDNQHSFAANIDAVMASIGAGRFEYLEPDEYRLDQLLKAYSAEAGVETEVFDSEHFYTSRHQLKELFEGKKSYLMETFYRDMRKQHSVLMDADKPVSGKWNYDHENRKKLPAKHVPIPPMLYSTDVSDIAAAVEEAGLSSIGKVDAKHFIWPTSRAEALELYDFFLREMLQYFGAFQDAMSQEHWSIYHSRISFAMNIKLISPKEVVEQAEAYWSDHQDTVSLAQVEGFIRQIFGWREYMRGIYWAKMPAYASENYFGYSSKLPSWYWTGETKMSCMSKAINQSLDYAYAHHIQRLMVTGNFALLAGIDPDEVDQWYLGIYIDAFEWVEITNTRGMSQFADGGLVGTKPYVSSGSYIHKMGDHCKACKYDYRQKTGEGACPFNSLYWSFIDRHRDVLAPNPRMSMMYRVWDKYDSDTKTALLEQAGYYLEHIEEL